MTEETIFLTALEKATPADRAAYLDAACAGDPALRQRVEALLQSHTDPDSFLDQPAIARHADPNRTTDRPDDEPAAEDDPLALLDPGGGPGALGRLDHYDVLEVIGRGGMGVVFKARDTRLQRVVAVKVLAAPLAGNASARQRFFREARAAAAVRDDHVVNIHAVSEDSGPTPYLVMEFIAGVTLEKRLKTRGPLAVKEVLRIGMQAAEGLAAAHKQGLIHRDVKPANILLENGVERVKITDFGLARAADDASLSQAGVVAGTPLYMSPEQARGETLDARSDLFSLGSVLYTLCTGQTAFAAGNTVAVLRRVCEETPRPIREVNPDIPEWLAAVVNKLLAKEPGERFQTATELAEVLGQHLAQLQQSRLAPAAAPEKPEAVPPPAAPAGAGGGAARTRKRLAVAALLVLAGAASLVVVAVLAWAWLFPSTGKATDLSIAGQHVPRVLTVSKRPEDGGRFRTVQAALDEVEPGKTIRVLDNGDYEEYLLIAGPQYFGVALEAVDKATFVKLPDKPQIIDLRGVSHFTLRGFRLKSGGELHDQITVTGTCPGVVLKGLDMTSDGGDCISMRDVSVSSNDSPIVIEDCTIRGGHYGVAINGFDVANFDRPLLSGGVVIRNNSLTKCGTAVTLRGAVHDIHVVGNRFLGTQFAGIDLVDFLPGTANILVANNTLWRNEAPLRVWDERAKDKDFRNYKNVRVQNNLIVEPKSPVDMMFFEHVRGDGENAVAGDVKSLLKSLVCRFSHNWREIDRVKAAGFPRWIPRQPSDHLEPVIEGPHAACRTVPNFSGHRRMPGWPRAAPARTTPHCRPTSGPCRRRASSPGTGTGRGAP